MRFIRLLFVLGLLSSCCRAPFLFERETVTTLTLVSTKMTNEGAPLYVVLKFTDFPHFLVDDYLSIIDLSLSSDPNCSSFITLCVLPGKREKVVVKQSQDQCMAIYCLFTNCGERWKQLIDTCEGYQSVTIYLGENEISAIELH
jgi:hypothetical protein